MHMADMPIYLLVVAVACLSAFLPSISRPGLLFSLTVTPEFATSDIAKAIVRAYRIRLAVSAIVVILFMSTMAGMPGYADIINIVGLLLFVLLSTVDFLWARHHIRPHAASPTRVQVSLAPVPALDIWPRPHWVMAIPYLMLLGSASWLELHWSAIPARFPVHIDAKGIANGWSDHTFMGVFGIVLLGLVICGMLNAMMLIGRHVRRLPQTAVRIRAYNWITVEVMMSIALQIGILAQLPLYGVVMVNNEVLLTGILIIIAVLASLIPIVIMLVMLRRAPAEPISGGGDRTPDRCWKWGLFYFNPDDPAVFVERRFGVGYALNMARPLAIMVIVAIIAFVAASIWLS